MTDKKLNNKRLRIVETALDLFTNQGLQQTSMAQISKESGVAVGTMYLNFKSKDELITGVFLHIQEAYGKYIRLDKDELTLPFKDQFKLVGKKSYDYYTNNPSHFFFVDTHNYSPLISKEVREEGRKYYQQAINLLMLGIKEGVFRDMHPILLIRWVYNGMVSLVQLKLSDDADVTEEMIDNTMERIWKGLV